MATNVLSLEGSHTAKYTTTGAVVSGAFLVVGNTPMVALEAVAAADAGRVIGCAVGCSAVLPKVAAASTGLTFGQRVYLSTTGGNKVTGVAAAGKEIGYALDIAATGATTAKVKLNSFPTILETQA